MRYAIRIVVFVVVVWLSLTGLEKLFDLGLRQNRNIKLTYVQNYKINADILVHGPCEPLWMIDPDVLDKQTHLRSYNLALSHSDFADNFLHLYMYLKNNKPPKYLFLYVTPESMDKKYNTFNTYRFAPYLNDSVVYNVVSECDTEYYKWISIPFMKYAYYNREQNFNVLQGYKHKLTDRKLPYFPNGFEPPAKIVWDNHLEGLIQLYPKGYNFEWNNLREKYLRKIIELAKHNNIKVFLYESPVLKEAIAYQPNRHQIIGKLKLLANSYGVDYIVFDNMEIANSREFYISILNFNLKGAELFTDSLGKFIRIHVIDPEIASGK